MIRNWARHFMKGRLVCKPFELRAEDVADADDDDIAAILAEAVHTWREERPRDKNNRKQRRLREEPV